MGAHIIDDFKGKKKKQICEMRKCSHGNGLKASGNHKSKPLMWVEDMKVRGFQQYSARKECFETGVYVF